MKTSSQLTEKDQNMDLLKSGRISAFFHVAFYTLAGLAIFAGAGYALDHWLGTFPALFIIGLVIAFPITQFVLYKKLRTLMQDKFEAHKSQSRKK